MQPQLQNPRRRQLSSCLLRTCQYQQLSPRKQNPRKQRSPRALMRRREALPPTAGETIVRKNLNTCPRTSRTTPLRKEATRTINEQTETRTAATTTRRDMAASEEGIRRTENAIFLKMMVEKESPWVKETIKDRERTRDQKTSILMRWSRKTTF